MGNDPRFRHTEQLLRKAFIQLMSTSGYDKITITQLINTAQINRTTFYAHYDDKTDLLEKLEENLLNGLTQRSHTLPADIFLHNLNEFDTPKMVNQISLIFEYLHANGQLLSLLLDPIKGDLTFATKLTATIKASWSKNHIISHLNVSEPYALAVASGVMGSMISEWVQRDFQESPNEFAMITLKIMGIFSSKIVDQSNFYPKI